MGVTGLWRLIEPAGKPVPVETLENKVLAVDISIWLHQMVKGYQDAKGAPLPNAHLMGLFQRLCKLLYFRIKPVFVFDGGFPDLKRETITKRQDNKSKYQSESERIKRELALLLTKKTAIGGLIGKHISPKKGNLEERDDDLFKLPAMPEKEDDDSESESEDDQNSSASTVDLHSVDVESDTFKKLPTKEKYDLLMELKETRKMNSWGRLHEMPQQSDNFSNFQMQRLLKRRKIQECIEDTEKEMGDCGMSLNELESLLNEEGIDTRLDELPTRRIASNNTTRFLLINDVKKALANAKKKEDDKNQVENKNQDNYTSVSKETSEEEDLKPSKNDELEDDLEKALKMSMECFEEPNTSANHSKTDDSWTSCLTDNDYSDSDSEEIDQPDMSSAKAYIMQYSDLTSKAIGEMLTNKSKPKIKTPNLDQILEDLRREKSIIIDKLELTTSDEEDIKHKSNIQNIKIENVSDESSDSVVSVNYSNENIISLDTTAVELYDKNVEQPNIEEEIENNKKIQYVEIIKDTNVKNDLVNVMKEKIININTSTDDFSNEDKFIQSDSDEEEFEEVPEDPKVANKPVVELTLNIGGTLDDDIFADVFENKVTSDQFPERVPNLITNEQDNKIENDKNKDSVLEKLINSAKSSQKPSLQIMKPTNPKDNSRNISVIESLPPNNSLASDSSVSNPSNINDYRNDKIQTLDSTTESKITNLIANTSENKNSTVAADISVAQNKLTEENLKLMVEEIQQDEADLLQEKGRLDRIGRNITQQMTKEAQELLQLFGIPYIVAPMEAEAQCAFLESVKLTDGTITDDSDIWLFGGKTVYKNFFNQKKHVLQFIAERIEKSFNLPREQLILLALLVGSDYTTGLNGVGPVTALEILASFPYNKKQYVSETSKVEKYTKFIAGLKEFKQWVRAGKRTDNTSLKKKLKNVILTDDFPSVRVVQAYMDPKVDKNEEKFTWGKLDITLIRDYAKSKFGWSQSKLDEIIKPVLKRMQDRKAQRTVHDYFQRKIQFQSLDDQMSKRVKAAVKKMIPNGEAGQDVTNETKAKPARKRKSGKKSGLVKDDGNTESIAGPSKTKQPRRVEEDIISMNQGVKVVSTEKDCTASNIDIIIPKTDKVQEIIPQREKDKQSMLQNKMKAIEVFRKTRMDPKRKGLKKKPILTKKSANLSESDSD